MSFMCAMTCAAAYYDNAFSSCAGGSTKSNKINLI